MNLVKKLLSTAAVAGALTLGAQRADAIYFYEDFSSGNHPAWYAIQADPVLSNPLAESFIQNEDGNDVFHLGQGDIPGRNPPMKGSGLLLNHAFSTGDTLEFDYNVFLSDSHQTLAILNDGSSYNDILLVNGVSNHHIKFEFQPNDLLLSIDGELSAVPLSSTDGSYSLYIGDRAPKGLHTDFDNLNLYGQASPPTTAVPDPGSTALGLGIAAALLSAGKRRFG